MSADPIVGIDPALANVGIVTLYGASSTAETVKSRPIPALMRTNPAAWSRRIEALAAEVATCVPAAAIVAIEGAAFGAKHGNPDERAGLRWSIVARLRFKHCQLVSIPPTSAKMWLTGNGNAGKDRMIEAARLLAPAELTIANEHEADAFALASIVAELAGRPIITKPPRANEVLKGIHWGHVPELSRNGHGK